MTTHMTAAPLAALPALREWVRRLPRAARVLDAHATDPRTTQLLNQMGLRAEANTKDLRLAQLGTAEWDGIWCADVFSSLPKEHCQRVLGSFFRAAKPGGLLMLTLNDGLYSEGDFSSLLRQMGFEPVAIGRTADRGSSAQVAYLARRIHAGSGTA